MFFETGMHMMERYGLTKLEVDLSRIYATPELSVGGGGYRSRLCIGILPFQPALV